MTAYKRTFVSYAREDGPLARQIATALKGHGVPVWFDEWEMERSIGEQGVFDAVRLALADCDAMVIIATPTYRDRVTVRTDHPIPEQVAMQTKGWPRSKYLAYENSVWTADSRRNPTNFTRITIKLLDSGASATAPTITRGTIHRVDVKAYDTTPAWAYFSYVNEGSEKPRGYREVGRFVEVSTESIERDLEVLLSELRIEEGP